jgi:hypothetical protein
MAKFQQGISTMNLAAVFSTTFYGQMAQVFLQKTRLSPRLLIVHSPSFYNLTVIENYIPPQISQAVKSELIPTNPNSKINALEFFSLYERESTYTGRLSLLNFVYGMNPYLSAKLYQRFFYDYEIPSFLGYPILGHIFPENLLSALYLVISDISNYDFIKTLVHAITLVESNFDFSAKSRTGAKGMMQLMPGTALDEFHNLVKKKLLSGKEEINLYSSMDNLILGTSHLQTLIGEYGFNLVLIAAAYNAGRGNVKKWLKTIGDPRTEKISTLEWIELIPFAETRNYVKKVVESFLVYTHLLNTGHLQFKILASF